MRTRDRPAARVANHSGKIADDENCLMSKVLKLSQFSQNNRVAKVNIRCGRVYPKLDAQRPAQRKLLAQFALIDDLRRSSMRANCARSLRWAGRCASSLG